MTNPASARELALLRWGVASIWLLTGVLVVHPHYRAAGAAYLAPLGLPAWVMLAACAGEVLLGMAVAFGRARTSLCALQAGAIAAFTAILAWEEPPLLVDRFGVLSKNLPILALIATSWTVEREGWTPRATWLLRGGMAVVWITEGLFPKVLYRTPEELETVARSGLVPFDPGAFLLFMGAAQIASGAAALALRGRALQALLACQSAALVFLPVLVSLQDPLLWVHPFGPLTKNVPILAGTLLAAGRARQ